MLLRNVYKSAGYRHGMCCFRLSQARCGIQTFTFLKYAETGAGG